MFASVPMQAMYRVLKDPDLESARLQVVAGYHEGVWCPFHQSGRPQYPPYALLPDPNVCDNGLGKRVGAPPLSQSGRGLTWLEIDLEGLVRRYGEVEEALRILKVGD